MIEEVNQLKSSAGWRQRKGRNEHTSVNKKGWLLTPSFSLNQLKSMKKKSMKKIMLLAYDTKIDCLIVKGSQRALRKVKMDFFLFLKR